jgi:hypothetical protein
MTKILNFNLSGNRLFKNEQPSIVIEDLGYCLEGLTEEEETKKDEYFYEHHTTLRDIAVLLYKACGQGVLWNLSRELAKKLDLSNEEVMFAIEQIVSEYGEMSEEEALRKYEELATYIEYYPRGKR